MQSNNCQCRKEPQLFLAFCIAPSCIFSRDSISGVDLVLIITEPSVSGIHNLERVFEVADHFEIETVVCINKYDVNEENTALIEEYCRNKGMRVVGKLPLSNIPTKAMLEGKTVIEYADSSFARLVQDMWYEVVR